MNSPAAHSSPAQSIFELHTFGCLNLQTCGGAELVSILSQPKRTALLCYLVLAGGFVRRDLLLPLFWPETDDAHARASLRQAIHFLRHSLAERALISRGDDEIKVDATMLWCDAVAFEAAIAKGLQEEAHALYRGHFLPGFFVDGAPEFEQWLDGQRDRFRRRALVNAWALAETRERAGDAEAAAEFGRAALALAPTDDALLRRFMLLLERTGNRNGALSAYEDYARRLRAEYESEPTPEVEELAQDIAGRSPPRPRNCVPVVANETVRAEPVAHPRKSRRWRRSVQIAVPSMLLSALLVYVAGLAPSAPIDTHREIVIADFANHTSDADLAAAVTHALAIDLAQSRHIRFASAQRIGDVLHRMRRSDVRVLTPELAREVAVREGLQAVLQGGVLQLGFGYTISAQLVTADSGRVLLSLRETARQPKDVLEAVDRLSAKLRRHTGESLRDVSAQQALAAVTTSSLDALKAYSASLWLRRQSLWEKREVASSTNSEAANRLLEQAIALDSTFAAAYRTYGVALFWSGQRARANQLLTRAFQLRDRLTERERLLTEGTYYSFVRDDYDAAIACFQRVLQSDPNDEAALLHLVNLYYLRKDYVRAAYYAHREWAVHGGAPSNRYVPAMLGAGRVARADSFLEYYAARETNLGVWHTHLIRLEQTRRNYHAVDTLFDHLQILAQRSSPAARALPTRLLGSWKIWRGAYADGTALIRASFPANSPAAKLELAFNIARYDVFVMHDRAGARRRLDDALRAHPLATVPAGDRPYLNLAQAYAFAGDYTRANALVREYQTVQAPLTTGSYKAAAVYNVGAIVNASQGHVARAREIMAEGEREIGCWESTPWLQLGRAVMEELIANKESIIGAWERFVAVPSCMVITSYDGAYASAMALAHAHERLAELYDARRDAQQAVVHYRKFIETWSTPDAALQPRWNAARRRLDHLSRAAAVDGSGGKLRTLR